MKIEKIYIGGWFQRTMLHLTEIYDFLRDGKGLSTLNEKKIINFKNDLDIATLEYEVNGFEYISYTTNSGICLKIYEDGLIILSDTNVDEDSLFKDIDALADYYENKFSPAISYIFSLGAPVPKELANIKTVYPYFIVLNKAPKTKMDALMQQADKQKYYSISNDNVDIMRGDKYYFINCKKKSFNQIERYIEEQIFIREFKGQLHRYLNLHRIIWERIDEVKENKHVTGKEILAFTNKLDGYAKTVNLVDSRINQMGTYLKTREKIAKKDAELQDFLGFMEYKYETLDDSLAYIKHIWSMTKNYVSSAKSLFKDLQSEVTQKSLSNLTVVTSMGVGASLIGLFTETKIPSVTIFGIGYFLALALIGWGVNKIMNSIGANRKYHVNDIEYDKNIK